MSDSSRIISHWRAAQIRAPSRATLVLSKERLAACRQVLARHASEVDEWSDTDVLLVMNELCRAALVVRSITPST